MFNSGHDGKSLSSRFGERRGRVGDQGESFLSKAFRNSGLYKFSIWHDLGLPARAGQSKLSTDVDFAIANGSNVILIDAKRWSGSFLWTLPNSWPMSGLLPLRMPKTRNAPKVWSQLSSNMAAAVDRYQQHLPKANVSAMVIFVPTIDSDRDSGPKHVEFLIFPGLIRSYRVGAAIGEIERVLGREFVELLPEITHLLNGLKNHR